MNIAYYINDIKPNGDRNSWCIMLLIDSESWPERTRVHKGATIDRYFITRRMNESEINDQKLAYRLGFHRYYAWQGLIEDEIRILGEDHPIISELEKKKLETKNIPLYRPGQTVLF